MKLAARAKPEALGTISIVASHLQTGKPDPFSTSGRKVVFKISLE